MGDRFPDGDSGPLRKEAKTEQYPPWTVKHEIMLIARSPSGHGLQSELTAEHRPLNRMNPGICDLYLETSSGHFSEEFC